MVGAGSLEADLKKIILGIIAVLVIGGGIFLATSDTKAEKAVKALASAREFAQKGDDARALVELRNALQSDGALREARQMFADLLLKAGRRADAFGQYRQLYTMNPDDLEAARQMALIAFTSMAWDEARQYSGVVLEKRPDDKEIQAVAAGLDYRDGLSAKNDDQISGAVAIERRLLAQDPSLVSARRILIANAIRDTDLEQALHLTDDGLVLLPDDRDMNNARLVLLERLGRTADLEKQLLAMIARFPDDEELGRTLVRFYVHEGRVDEAEKILRDEIDPNGDKTEPRMVLLRFLSEVRSPAVMRAELARTLAETPLPKDVASDLMLFKALQARADFAVGERDKAMSDMEALIKGAAPSAEVDRIKVQLAGMRLATENAVGSRALVEEVLAHDPSQVDAMKLKAAWLIDEDQTEPAISLLRDALADAPTDSKVMVLMSRAYEREGRPELMADMMARAVEVSNQAPSESLIYARWLFLKGEYGLTETVLVNALRRQPVNLDLLEMLARTHIAMKDWARVQQDIDAIGERFKTDQARDLINGLQAQVLSGQGRSDELTQFLDQMSQNPDKELEARIAIIRSTVVSGHLDQALAQAQKLASEKPDAPVAAFLVAQIMIAQNDITGGSAAVSALLATHPEFLPGWLTLQGVQLREGKFDDALKTVEDAQAKIPDNRALLLSKAFILEKKGDIDGAVAIYEGLYTANSNDLVVANNLASLLASTRDDQASLDRAWTVARRLNGTTVPAFLDTYGWISFRRGDAATGVSALEKAVKGLPDDPSVAYHLGRAYASQGSKDLAAAQYARTEQLLTQGAIGYPDLAQDLVKARAELK